MRLTSFPAPKIGIFFDPMTPASYRIQKITRETHNVIVWEVVPEVGEIPVYKSGQFAMIHLLNPDGGVWKKKAYSMSSSPRNKEFLEFGIKVHGDFTQKMETLQVGERVLIQAPFGSFVYEPDIHKDAVMFAGGIGVTPFLSMARFAFETAPENKITIFYCNQTENDIAYKNALAELQTQNSNFHLICSVDQCITNSWTREIGFIDETRVKKYVPDFSGKHFFMCGPMPFMKSVGEILKNNAVPLDRVKREVF